MQMTYQWPGLALQPSERQGGATQIREKPIAASTQWVYCYF